MRRKLKRGKNVERKTNIRDYVIFPEEKEKRSLEPEKTLSQKIESNPFPR